MRAMRAMCGKARAGLIVRHAVVSDAIVDLAATLKAQAVFAVRNYEPQAMARDTQVQKSLAQAGCAFFTCKDQVIFEAHEVLTQSGTPYGVFMPCKPRFLS